jgi:DnaJ-class molecular chaperone
MEKRTYYDVLEIPVSATLQEIHNAYMRAKNAYSGDSVALYSLMTQDECEKILEQIEEAYTVLGAADKRKEYDKARGLNQNQTVAGFTEEIINRPSYKPQHSLDSYIKESNSLSEDQQFELMQRQQKEEYKYNNVQTAKNEVTVSKVQAFKKFGLSFNSNQDFEQQIENCTEYTGEFLRQIREYKNVTIERMADMTRISKTYIKNIEDDDFTKLPADVYTRGFVYQYAKCLKLNPDLVATSYIHHIKMLKNPKQ